MAVWFRSQYNVVMANNRACRTRPVELAFRFTDLVNHRVPRTGIAVAIRGAPLSDADKPVWQPQRLLGLWPECRLLDTADDRPTTHARYEKEHALWLPVWALRAHIILEALNTLDAVAEVSALVAEPNQRAKLLVVVPTDIPRAGYIRQALLEQLHPWQRIDAGVVTDPEALPFYLRLDKALARWLYDRSGLAAGFDGGLQFGQYLVLAMVLAFAPATRRALLALTEEREEPLAGALDRLMHLGLVKRIDGHYHGGCLLESLPIAPEAKARISDLRLRLLEFRLRGDGIGRILGGAARTQGAPLDHPPEDG